MDEIGVFDGESDILKQLFSLQPQEKLQQEEQQLQQEKQLQQEEQVTISTDNDNDPHFVLFGEKDGENKEEKVTKRTTERTMESVSENSQFASFKVTTINQAGQKESVKLTDYVKCFVHPNVARISGSQLFINYENGQNESKKPSVRIFPNGGLTVQGRTKEQNILRANEIVDILVKNGFHCEAEFTKTLAATYNGVFFTKNDTKINHLRLANLRFIINMDKEKLYTATFKTETDNCVKISLSHDEDGKEGQLRIFQTGKVLCLGVKNPILLQQMYKRVSAIIQEHENVLVDNSVRSEDDKDKQKKERKPVCSACGGLKHNKRTCPKNPNKSKKRERKPEPEPGPELETKIQKKKLKNLE